MRYLLENEEFCLEIESLGAEMRSLRSRKSGQEYLWSGDPAYWNGVSPLLFPFIGMLKNKTYRWKGKEYSLERHGFAQKMDFSKIRQSKDSIVLAITDTEDTRAVYPFSFCLEVEYQLTSTGVTETWRVQNHGQERMYFSIGGHPALACPPSASGTGNRTDYSIGLLGVGQREIVDSLRVIPGGLLSGETIAIPVKNEVIPITETLFDIDTILLQEQIQGAALCDRTGNEYIRVESTAPVWGIWSKEDSNASYICLEPWYGLCDYANFEGTLEERPFTNGIDPKEIWEGGFQIQIRTTTY